jgi:hypothetical protein
LVVALDKPHGESALAHRQAVAFQPVAATRLINANGRDGS